MECLNCSRVCPTKAIEMDKTDSCIRLLEVRHPVGINEEKCTECGMCDQNCPIGDIALSAEGCLFCIICKNMPNCILPSDDRVSFFNSVSSIARFMVLVLIPRIIFKRSIL